MKGLFATANDMTLTLMRLVLGVVFFVHGAQLTLGWFGGHTLMQTAHGFGMMGIPLPLALIAILAQFLGGLGLILGCLARIAAFGIAIDMLVAIFTVHIHVGFFMNWFGVQKGEGYEYHLLVLALCVLIMVKGAGALSIDRALGSRSSS
ncbi:DoxX family protein [Acidipila rosea]|uniref:Putative oxidoreductase n=1 Tax=Acidipila rosea TaxID=768535 RepID=A0A4R1KXS3_9BACT|nr:DoxX family protein [Acidipila rosea]TCK70232.1 putative oxidoreductase [Acidipila rosea]